MLMLPTNSSALKVRTPLKIKYVFLLLLFTRAALAQTTECKKDFLNTLQANDPQGFAVWNKLSADSQNYLQDLFVCEPSENITGLNAGTLVHEAIHQLDSQLNLQNYQHDYYLVNGDIISYQSDVRDGDYANARGQALQAMSESERKLSRAKTYLYDLGYETFYMLLDELNAYSHGLNTILHFSKAGGNDLRDGPLEMVVFTLRYLNAISRQSPDYYLDRIMGSKDLLEVIKKLVGQAFDVYNSSCDRDDLNMDDSRSIEALSSQDSQLQLKAIFATEVPVVSENCIKNSKKSELSFVTPVDFRKGPDDPSTLAGQTNSDLYEQLLKTHYDPQKPSIDVFIKRLDSVRFTMKFQYLEYVIVIQVGPKEEDNFMEWNGKKLTTEESNKKQHEFPELASLVQNAHYIETSGTPTR